MHAKGDMVGHTRVYTAIGSAVKTIDQSLNEVVETAPSMGYETIITADSYRNFPSFPCTFCAISFVRIRLIATFASEKSVYPP